MLVIADSELRLLAADLNPNHKPPRGLIVTSSDMTVVCLVCQVFCIMYRYNCAEATGAGLAAGTFHVTCFQFLRCGGSMNI